MSTGEGRPALAPADVGPLVARFGVDAEGLEFDDLPAYDDLNLRIKTAAGRRYVLKVHNAELNSGSRARLEAQDRFIGRLAERGLPVPEVIISPSSSSSIIPLDPPAPGRAAPLARLLTYLEGDIVPNETPKDEAFLQRVGMLVGKVTAALAGFEDPAAHWSWEWDMKIVPKTVRSKLSFIKDEAHRELATRLADEYEATVCEAASTLPHSIIHSDLNDTNLLFRDNEVVGVLDFGDSIYSCTIFDCAIAAGYYSLGQADPMMVLTEVLRGYMRTAPSPPSAAELAVYFQAARGRLLLSVACSAEACFHKPDDEYLAHTAEPGWAALAKLAAVPTAEAMSTFAAVASG